MAISEGIRKVVNYKKESTFGELPGATNGKTLRRVTSSFNLNKEVYQSEEIRTDYQVFDSRHGVRSGEGTLNGELSPGSYSEFIAAALARDFTVGVGIIGISLTIASVTGGYTLTRATGSFLTGGIKVGDTVRLSGSGLNAANSGKNALVISVTALVLTVIVLNNTVMVPEGPITGVDVTVVGGKTYAPLTGHTSDSFTFEEWYSDITLSQVHTGVKVNTIGLQLPATGLTTIDINYMGQNLKQQGNVRYFSNPAGSGNSRIFAAVNGALVVGGQVLGLVTGLNININRNLSGEAVVGSNIMPEIFDGRIVVDGEFTAFLTGVGFADLFNNETETSLIVSLTTSSLPNADFMTIVLPRIKINSDTRDDGEKGIVSTHSFQALLNFEGGAGLATEATTISVQDSTFV